MSGWWSKPLKESRLATFNARTEKCRKTLAVYPWQWTGRAFEAQASDSDGAARTFAAAC
jgi:hypothetical protein